MQRSYSTLFGRDPFDSDRDAKAMRDSHYRALRVAGIKSHRWILRDQLKPWESFGVPCGKVCDIYMLDIDVDSLDLDALDRVSEVIRS